MRVLKETIFRQRQRKIISTLFKATLPDALHYQARNTIMKSIILMELKYIKESTRIFTFLLMSEN